MSALFTTPGAGTGRANPKARPARPTQAIQHTAAWWADQWGMDTSAARRKLQRMAAAGTMRAGTTSALITRKTFFGRTTAPATVATYEEVQP